MQSAFSLELFLLVVAAVLGGLIAKLLKTQALVGYILIGLVLRLIFKETIDVQKISEIGIILLLFSIGLELSIGKLGKLMKSITFGVIAQVVLVSLASFFLLRAVKIDAVTSLILSLGFSLSSTAVIFKLLSERGEVDTLHGELMVSWSLVQDLLTIPMIVIIPALAANNLTGGVTTSIGLALLKAVIVIALVIFLGRLIAPKVLHKVAGVNSRELLVLSAVALALGTAFVTSFFGVAPAIGAFLAGLVISESQESLAVFAETRPLRDLFVAVFFVSLGFMIIPAVLIGKIGLILLLAAFVIVVKAVIIFIISLILKHKGKTALATGLGLAQVGEFAFVLFALANSNNLISSGVTSIGIATVLLTLLVSPFLYKAVTPLWRKLRMLVSKNEKLNGFVCGFNKATLKEKREFSDHIIICGYGRVGGWVGKALDSMDIPFVVVDYSQEVVNKLCKKGTPVIYGDPTEPEVLEAAGIKKAKALVVAVPDNAVQEAVIALSQTLAPEVKIISRVHTDEEWNKLKTLKVQKIIQPEFEGAVAIVRSMLYSMGRSQEEINERIKKLRQSRAMS